MEAQKKMNTSGKVNKNTKLNNQNCTYIMNRLKQRYKRQMMAYGSKGPRVTKVSFLMEDSN